MNISLHKTTIHNIILISAFWGCGYSYKIETELELADKIQIAQGIIDNIEYERLSLMGDSQIIAQFDSVLRPVDHSGVYSFYADRRLRNSSKYRFYPQPASSQIDAIVDQIFYSKDSLKCAAFIILDIHFDILPEFEDPKTTHKYEGFAIYGIRENIEKPFRIYPLHAVTISSEYDYKHIKRNLSSIYTTKLISEIVSTSGTYMENTDQKYWFGHNKFFEDSPDFKTDSSGIFWAEYDYQPGQKPIRKFFYSNRDKPNLNIAKKKHIQR